MEQNIGKKLFPGTIVAKYKGEDISYGLYIDNQTVYSSIFGHLHKQNNVFTVVNSFPQKKIGICVGDIVYGKVLKVKEQECSLQILQINQISCLSYGNKHMEATIKKQNVREKMVDSVVMIDCFRPRDIIKAKVISLGDSVRSIYLSTAGQSFGVLIAQHEQTGKLMLPFDWSSMVDVENSMKEPRKVCKPEMQ